MTPQTIPPALLSVDNLCYLSRLRYRLGETQSHQEMLAGMSPDCAVLHDWITEHCGVDYIANVTFPTSVSEKIEVWFRAIAINPSEDEKLQAIAIDRSTQREQDNHTQLMLRLLDRWLP